MVTAEIAAALPALVMILIAAVWTVTLAVAQLRCSDAAREAARAAARGEDVAVVRQVAEEIAPTGADITVEHADQTVTVKVRTRMSMPGPLGDELPAPWVEGAAVAAWEAE